MNDSIFNDFSKAFEVFETKPNLHVVIGPDYVVHNFYGVAQRIISTKDNVLYTKIFSVNDVFVLQEIVRSLNIDTIEFKANQYIDTITLSLRKNNHTFDFILRKVFLTEHSLLYFIEYGCSSLYDTILKNAFERIKLHAEALQILN